MQKKRTRGRPVIYTTPEALEIHKKEWQQTYYKKNRKKIIARSKQWQQDNIERHREHNARSVARIRSLAVIARSLGYA